MSNYKIAMFSFADINNFGDILFSHIFKMEMENRIPGVQVDCYTPASISLEGINYIGYTKEKVDGKYDALILSGGEVIHLFDERTWEPIYKKSNLNVESAVPSDVVWDWTNCAARLKAWISVGVRPFEDKWDEQKINQVINDLDFLSVRGILSKKILEGDKLGYYNPKISITPDLGWFFPKYLQQTGQEGMHYKKHVDGQKPYIIYQVNNINEDEAALIASQLVEVQEKYNMQVYLLPVIHPWEDVKYLRMIEQKAEGKLKLLSNELTILEIADIIVHAHVVLCSSLHTAITALAAGIPAAIINKWQGTKLQDLFGLQFRTEFLSDSFGHTALLLQKLIEEKENSATIQAYAAFMSAALTQLFDNLAKQIVSDGRHN